MRGCGCSFLLATVCFFVFLSVFWVRKDSLANLFVYFPIFPQCNYTRDGKLDAWFFCYMSVVRTNHLIENSNVFFSLKYCLLQIFWFQKKKITLPCKIKYCHIVKHIFIDLQKFKYYSLWSKSHVKIKRSDFFLFLILSKT